MALIKVKVDEKIYQLDRLTLGDGVVLKRRFGLAQLDMFNPADPETMLGLLTLAISKTDGVSISEAEEIASEIEFDAMENIAEEQDEPGPLEGDAAEETAKPVQSGSSAKRPRKPGTPR